MTTEETEQPDARVPVPLKRMNSIGEIAAYCLVSRSNVKKMLIRYGVEPYEVLGIGPIYTKASIERMQAKRLADKTARAADAQRRLSARRGR